MRGSREAKQWKYLTGITALLAMLVGGAYTAGRTQEFPDEIMISNDGYQRDRKGPVAFSHLDHTESYGAACNECHHVYEDQENVWNQGDPVNRCSECHYPDQDDDVIRKLSIAFHRNCKGCHKRLAREGITDDAPYKQCTDCHGI